MMNAPARVKIAALDHKNPPRGLSSEEALNRQQQHGLNELPRHDRGWVNGFLSYFWGPIPWAFMITAVICVVAKLWFEAEMVGAGFLALALFGCASEYSGRRRVAKLRTKLHRPALVERDGVWRQLPSSELVPGDLIRLKQGDIVPADVHLVAGDAVGINVVHPSYPINHVFQVGDLLYGGSLIDFGDAYAVVYAIGSQTRLGQKVQRLVEHMNASRFYEGTIFKFDKSILHFDEPLGGEWKTVDFSEDHREPSH